MQSNNSTSKAIGLKAPIFALTAATLLLVINFWAWSLLSPLATQYAKQFNLSQLSVAILLALPVIVGSLGRIPAGILTDRYGGRLVFGLACIVLAIPVALATVANSISLLAIIGICLGVGGATFAIGVPFVSSWFSAKQRGLALGLYSMGNAGSAVSGFLTPNLVQIGGKEIFFGGMALTLLLCGTLFLLFARNSPNWQPSTGSVWQAFKQSLSSRVAWDLSLVYAITFGAFVAFVMYLPVLLEVSYDLQSADAAARAAGFVLLATIARPLGGWLSDRMGGLSIIRAVLGAIILLAIFIATQSTLTLFTTIAFLSLAVVLGCGNGAAIAVLSRRIEPEKLGGAVGLVGAIGGLGGFLPPIILGASYQLTESYMLALALLALASLSVFIYITRRFKTY